MKKYCKENKILKTLRLLDFSYQKVTEKLWNYEKDQLEKYYTY